MKVRQRTDERLAASSQFDIHDRFVPALELVKSSCANHTGRERTIAFERAIHAVKQFGARYGRRYLQGTHNREHNKSSSKAYSLSHAAAFVSASR